MEIQNKHDIWCNFKIFTILMIDTVLNIGTVIFEYFFYSFILAYEKKGLFVQLKFRMEKLLIGS